MKMKKNLNVEIEYLKYVINSVNIVAEWLFNQWGYLTPNSSMERAKRRLIESANVDKIPLAIIALNNNKPIGVARLVKNDMYTRPKLTPWIATYL
jgi:hypothetical protein